MPPAKALICLVLSATLGLAGCRIPQSFGTRSNITMDTVAAKDSSPIVAMPVGTAAPCAATVALVDVDGLLLNENRTGLMSVGTNPVADFRAKLDYARCHPELRAVVVRINSAGGGVTASDIMWRDLQAFRAETGRPVVACLMDVGAGGAYYLATAADLIVAHPTTITGGFGVILNLYNMEDMLAQMNIIGVPVKAGSEVDLGTPIRRMSAESRAILQQIADGFQQRFYDRIELGRGLLLEGSEEFLDGRILTADQALRLKLIDSIGYVDDAIQLAGRQVGAVASRPVLLHRCRDRAQTVYAITPNQPLDDILPVDVPGLKRADLPSFLYMWQPNPTYGG